MQMYEHENFNVPEIFSSVRNSFLRRSGGGRASVGGEFRPMGAKHKTTRGLPNLGVPATFCRGVPNAIPSTFQTFVMLNLAFFELTTRQPRPQDIGNMYPQKESI